MAAPVGSVTLPKRVAVCAELGREPTKIKAEIAMNGRKT